MKRIVTARALLVTFTARAGQSYSVCCRDALDASHPYTKLADIPAQAVTSQYTFSDTATVSSRFYQVVTPAQP